MRARALIRSLAVAVVAVLLAIIVRTVADGTAGGTTGGAAPRTSAPVAETRRPCGEVRTEDGWGSTIVEAFLASVRLVHDAACRRDYGDLILLMDSSFGGTSPQDAIADMRRFTPEGVALDILAATLETTPAGGQGGLIYCQPHGAIATFSRGTLDRSGGWSDFKVIRHDRLTCGA